MVEKTSATLVTEPCRFCGEPTPFLWTRTCIRCWELKTRMEKDLGLTYKILRAIEEEKGIKKTEAQTDG